MKNKSTYSLDQLRNTVCKSPKDVEAVESALQGALELFQWAYQNTNNHQQYRNASSGASKAIKKVVALLRVTGDDTLADSVEYKLSEYAEDSILIRSKVLSSAKNWMIEEFIKISQKSKSTYKNRYSTLMEEAFKELCDTYPLESAPDHFDSDFDPYSY